MVNKWIEHVKKYAKDNNVTYACAISEAKKTYVKIDKKAEEEKKAKSNRSLIVKKLVNDIKNAKDKDEATEKAKRKYKDFSKGLKDYIKDNAPKLHAKLTE